MRSAVSAGPRPAGALRPLALLTTVLTALLLAATGPAAAIGDPTRPTGQVVYGPNCTDGFIRVAVTNGTEAHTLTLSYDGAPAGPATDVPAGAQATLEGTEVEWGVTVEVTVAVAGPAGAEEPLSFLTYTRPSEEDCAAVEVPTTPPTTSTPSSTPAPTTSTPTTSSPPTSTAPTTTPTTTPAPTTTTPTTSPRPTPSTSVPSTTPAPPTTPPPTGTPGGTTSSEPVGGTVSSGEVSPGGVVTVRGSGFAPGELVTVSLAGVAAPLATVAAGADGRVEAVVQIPQDVVLGPATVQLLGRESAASTAVDLQVAAAETTEAGRTPWPLVVGGLGLMVVAVVLAAAAARRPSRDDWAPPGAVG